MTTDIVRAVLRLRTLGPSGLNPPQVAVIDRLQTLSEDEDGPITHLDVDMWGASMGITQTEDYDPEETRETVAEFKQWADEHDCTLRPAFEYHSAKSEAEGENQNGRLVTPLITLAVYTEEDLQAVYPHVENDEVNTIHDGIEELKSMVRDTEQPEDEQHEKLVAPLQ
ncbi:HTH domain-containing protein [Halalkalicoccus sp. GCM10025322]|uniref:HTH domain-containing protein n=1 Tax=Halalkalicoccus TaxID=332246 RepID=UPI002F966CA2